MMASVRFLVFHQIHLLGDYVHGCSLVRSGDNCLNAFFFLSFWLFLAVSFLSHVSRHSSPSVVSQFSVLFSLVCQIFPFLSVSVFVSFSLHIFPLWFSLSLALSPHLFPLSLTLQTSNHFTCTYMESFYMHMYIQTCEELSSNTVCTRTIFHDINTHVHLFTTEHRKHVS